MPQLGIWLSLIGAIGSLAAAAQEAPPDRVLLWRNLYAGMTFAELKALYPGFKGWLSSDCPVRVLSRYRKGKLISVDLLGRDRDGPCSSRVIAELNGQYGEGTVEDHTQSSITIVGTVYLSHRRDIVWKAEGKTIRLALMPGKPLGFNLIFTTRTDGGLF